MPPARLEARAGGLLRSTPGSGPLLAGVAALAAVYYVAAKGGYALQFTGSIAAIWPPVGLAVGVLYLGGLRWWPGAVIGDLLSNTWTAPLGTTLAVTAANLAEILVATLLLWRLIGRRAQLDRLDQVGGMLVAIAPAVAISATVGSLSLLADGVIHSHELASVWRTLWLGDASGALIVLPLILAWAHPPAWRAARTLEVAAMIAAVVGLSELELSSSRPLAFLVFPALIWAAVRFGQQGATVAVACAAGMAVWRTAHHVGPFVQHSITQSALSTQLYIAVAALTTLFLGAVVSERQRSAADLVDRQAPRGRARGRAAPADRARLARLGLPVAVFDDLACTHRPARSRPVRFRAGRPDRKRTGGGRDAQPVGARRDAGADLRAAPRRTGRGGAGRRPDKTRRSGQRSRSIDDHRPRAGRAPAPEPGLRGAPLSDRAGGACQRDQTRRKPQHAQVTVTSDDDLVVLEVRDDGRGFDPTAVFVGHLGLESMRSRATEIGAAIRVDSRPGQGTLVVVELPVATESAVS